MITWVTLVVIYCATGVAVLARLGIPVTSLVAPAAVAAVALGFGAQRIVQDILAGFFIITERQYGFGDLIRLSVPSLPDPAIGTVEDVTLRVTTVRTADGEVVITPNGQITQVTNLSRDWARAVVDVLQVTERSRLPDACATRRFVHGGARYSPAGYAPAVYGAAVDHARTHRASHAGQPGSQDQHNTPGRNAAPDRITLGRDALPLATGSTSR